MRAVTSLRPQRFASKHSVMPPQRLDAESMLRDTHGDSPMTSMLIEDLRNRTKINARPLRPLEAPSTPMVGTIVGFKTAKQQNKALLYVKVFFGPQLPEVRIPTWEFPKLLRSQLAVGQKYTFEMIARNVPFHEEPLITPRLDYITPYQREET